jgi:hypothetical protein
VLKRGAWAWRYPRIARSSDAPKRENRFMNSHAQDEMAIVRCVPASMLPRGPIEVNLVEQESTPEKARPPASPQTDVAQPAARLTTDEMMASMRALRQQRATCDEAESVLDEIVNDDSPGSLMADLQRRVQSI